MEEQTNQVVKPEETKTQPEQEVSTLAQDEAAVAKARDEAEAIMYANKIAETAGENTDTFESFPLITMNNRLEPSPDDIAIGAKLGSIMQSIRTEAGWEAKVIGETEPLIGTIIKVRYSLRTKYKEVEEGCHKYYSDEFSAFRGQQIVVKEMQEDKLNNKVSFKEVFRGDYPSVKANYSYINKHGKEINQLDLIANLYVVVGLGSDNPSLVKVQMKGLSRGAWFDYTKMFNHRNGDNLSAHHTVFGSQIVSESDGKALPRKVAVFTLTKDRMLLLHEMKQLAEFQEKFEKELEARDNMFNKSDVADTEPSTSGQIAQTAPADELPTIQIEDEKVINEAVDVAIGGETKSDKPF